MHTHFNSIGIIGKQGGTNTVFTLLSILRLLRFHHYRVVSDNETASTAFVEDDVPHYPLDELGKHCDLLIAVGGDGTFLKAVRVAAQYDVPLIGVNLGRLGFLVDISPQELQLKLEQILQGHYQEEKRHPLQAQIMRNGEVIHQQIAINEVVVHRWVTPSMIELVTHINGVYLNTQRSDGLIISTPTGSTAYALSAGGPILHPSLNALVLVPLNPHTLSNRPIVIDDQSNIEIEFSQTKQINALVTCDHLEIPDVRFSDKIRIQKSAQPIRILHPDDYDFFHILRHKLNWSTV